MGFMSKLPSFYENNIVRPIQQALDTEANILKSEVDNLFNQMFVDDATFGLDYWEKMLGIKKNNLDIQTRRENIKAKMRSTTTTTIQAIKNICEAYSNGEVDIKVFHSEYRFEIHFVGSVGIPPAFDELDKTIEKIKPCHLAHSYKFTYTNHKDLEKYTHEQLERYTHDEIRNGALKGVQPMPPTLDSPPTISQDIANQEDVIGTTFTINYTATDDNCILTHEIFNGSSWTVKTPTSTENTHSITIKFTKEGVKKCKIRVTDAKNQVAESNEFTVTVNENVVAPSWLINNIADIEGAEYWSSLWVVFSKTINVTKFERCKKRENGEFDAWKSEDDIGNNKAKIHCWLETDGVFIHKVRITDDANNVIESNEFKTTRIGGV